MRQIFWVPFHKWEKRAVKELVLKQVSGGQSRDGWRLTPKPTRYEHILRVKLGCLRNGGSTEGMCVCVGGGRKQLDHGTLASDFWFPCLYSLWDLQHALDQSPIIPIHAHLDPQQLCSNSISLQSIWPPLLVPNTPWDLPFLPMCHL